MSSETMKKSTAYTAMALLFLVGFVAGVVFMAFKMTGNTPHRHEGETASIPAPAMPEKEPQTAAEWARQGHFFFDQDDPGRAIEAYERSLALDPDNADVWTDLGVMYRRSGKPEKAVECFTRAADIDPAHEVSRFNRGIVLLHDLNDVQGAIESWEELVAINPLAMAGNGQSVDELIRHFKEHDGTGKQEP